MPKSKSDRSQKKLISQVKNPRKIKIIFFVFLPSILIRKKYQTPWEPYCHAPDAQCFFFRTIFYTLALLTFCWARDLLQKLCGVWKRNKIMYSWTILAPQIAGSRSKNPKFSMLTVSQAQEMYPATNNPTDISGKQCCLVPFMVSVIL